MSELLLNNENKISFDIGDCNFKFFFDFESGGNYVSSDTHSHSFFEFFCVENGEMIFSVNQARIALNANEVLVFAPNCYHNIESFSSDLKCYCGLFIFKKKKSGKLQNDFYENISKTFMFNSYKHIKNCENLMVISKELFTKKNDFTAKYRNSAFATAWFFLLNDYIKKTAKAKENSSVLLNYSEHKYLIDLYFARHYHEDISILNLAEFMNLSPKTVSKIINASYGVSFVKHKNRYRIEKAKKLLTQTDMPINEIALKVGYNTHRTFYKVFSELESCTASEYRSRF